MNQPLAVTVLCGGQSTEHEISILSARNVVESLTRDQYRVNVIYIDQQGQWRLLKNSNSILTVSSEELLKENMSEILMLNPGNAQYPWISSKNPNQLYRVDCVLPFLHGTYGEDGTIQGLLEILGVPYVGAGVLSSSICMHKPTAKLLLRKAGLPTIDYILVEVMQAEHPSYEQVVKQFGPVLLIKPASLGSSVGMTKVSSQSQFVQALATAFRYDQQVLIEPFIVGREIECAVLGNGVAKASIPGEVISHHEFYTYTAKYLDPHGATLEVPAQLSEKMVEVVQSLAIKAFYALSCQGMARVDFFVVNNSEVYINEVNTIPGFTNNSLYPKMWLSTQLSYSELLNQLISLAIERHQRQRLFQRIYKP